MPAVVEPPPAIRWQSGELSLLDQTQLPERIVYEPQPDIDTLWHAIRALKVRGAPAIGVAAAYGMAVAAAQVPPGDDFVAAIRRAGERLKSARPTAVNLAWAVDQQMAAAEREPNAAALAARAERIHADDEAMCRAIGEHGVELIQPGTRVLTHCNAGALAVSRYGTATAPLYLAHARGVPFRVFADETRPLLQGARLTVWELARAGIDATLLCDSMAASLMQAGGLDCVIVGTDRVAANGDVVNKIGTLGVAVLAQHFGVPFYVACPASTYDPHTPAGADVTIEQRAPEEVTAPFALPGVRVHNPAFDVTPAALVRGYITDVGLLSQADLPRLGSANARLMAD